MLNKRLWYPSGLVSILVLVDLLVVSCAGQPTLPVAPTAVPATEFVPAASPTHSPLPSPQAEAEPLDIAQRLAEQGQLLFEDEPLLGLRLALEGWWLVPPGDEEVRDSIMETIQGMARQGRLLKLGDDLEYIFSSPDGTSFILDRASAPGELHRSLDGQAVSTLTGQVSWVAFSPDGAPFVVGYSDAPGELRRTADGQVVATLKNKVNWANFSPDGAYFVLDYADAADELRRTSDLQVVATLTGQIGNVHLSPDGAYFVVDYDDAPSELRRTADGQVVPLTGVVDWIAFDPDGATFVVAYTDAPGEVRRIADGQVIQHIDLSDRAFGPDRAFSPDRAHYVVAYVELPGELRRTADDQVIATLTAEVLRLGGYGLGVYYSPDGAYFVVNYSDAPPELRRTGDGQVVATLTSVVVRPEEPSFVGYPDSLGVVFSPDGTYFLIGYPDASGELRRTADGQVVANFTGGAEFSPDGAYFVVVNYEEGRSELWAARDEARLLAKFDLGRPELFLFRDPQRLVVKAEDRAYLLDLAWLRAMGGDPAALASEELVRIICEGPMASGLFDESTLVPYLDGRQPQACTNSVPLSTGREGLKGEVFDSYLDKLTAFDTFPSGIDTAIGI